MWIRIQNGLFYIGLFTFPVMLLVPVLGLDSSAPEYNPSLGLTTHIDAQLLFGCFLNIVEVSRCHWAMTTLTVGFIRQAHHDISHGKKNSTKLTGETLCNSSSYWEPWSWEREHTWRGLSHNFRFSAMELLGCHESLCQALRLAIAIYRFVLLRDVSLVTFLLSNDTRTK